MQNQAFSITNFLPQSEGSDLILCNNGGKGLGQALPNVVDRYASFEVKTWIEPYWAYIQYDIRVGGTGPENTYCGQIQLNVNNETPASQTLPIVYESSGAQLVLSNVSLVRQGEPGEYWYKLEAEVPSIGAPAGGQSFSVTNELPQYQSANLILCNNAGKGLGASLPAEVNLYENFQVDTWEEPGWAYIQYDIRAGGTTPENTYCGQIQLNLDNQTQQTPTLPVTYVADGAQVELSQVTILRQGEEGGYWYKLEAELPAPPKPTSYSSVPFRGINLAGGDFGPPPVLPAPSDVNYFIEQGMNTARVPLKWEYLQPDLTQNIDWSSGYPQQASQLIQQLTQWGVSVILDIHNYMRYDANDPSTDSQGNNFIIGSGNSGAPTANQYASLWSQIAGEFAQNSAVNFDLMNEPFNMDTTLILSNYNAAIKAIRDAENQARVSPHLLLLEGNSWSGLHSWTDNQTGGSNASVLIPANIVDPANLYAINVHQYFDSDFSGTHSTCVTSSTVLEQINFAAFLSWVQTQKVRVIVTEFGTGGSANCGQDIAAFLGAIDQNPYTADHGGFIGWTAWAGGSFDSSYILSLNPGGPANPLIDSTYSQFLTKPT